MDAFIRNLQRDGVPQKRDKTPEKKEDPQGYSHTSFIMIIIK